MNSPGNIDGLPINADNAHQYFRYGKNLIKITEYFAVHGKPINELVEELIHHKIKQKVSKIA